MGRKPDAGRLCAAVYRQKGPPLECRPGFHDRPGHHGFTFISKFQLGTQPFWLALQCLALFAVLSSEFTLLDEWTRYQGSAIRGQGNGFDLLLFGAAASILFAMVAQIGEQVDYLRFLPPRESTSPWRWWTALIAAGPGWILIGIVKMLIGSFLAFLMFRQGLPLEAATDPTLMYQMAFNSITHSPQLSLALAGVMVIISQMKINVTNAYAGSIAWSNFFSRLTHSHPGRVVWLFFNVSIALLLMELNIYRVLENILGIFAVVAVGWLGSLSATLLTTFVVVPLLGYLTRGRYYIAREPSLVRDLDSDYQCCICENHFDYEDMSHCPAYQGPICSLCCSLDARCQDSCKPNGRITTQIQRFLNGILPEAGVRGLNSRLGHFLVILTAISLLNAALLALVYYPISAGSEAATASQLVEDMLWTLFFVLMIISGILAWLYLLAHESRLEIRTEQVDLHALLSQLVDMFRMQAESKSIDFIYECSPHLPQYVHSDEKRLRQILINLLSNAIKFTEHGSVTLRIRYRSQVAEFSIIDTGVGIEADDWERITVYRCRARRRAWR